MIANPLSHPGPDRIVVAGDWHGNTGRGCSVIMSAGIRGIPVVLHLGDFGFWTPGAWTTRYLTALEDTCAAYGVTLLWVDGNHECFPALYGLPVDPETGMRPITPHIAHLPRGLRWKWHGHTWMALGGAHSVDRRDRKEGVSWWPEEHLSAADIETATAPGPVDVIVSHDAPDGVLIPGLTPNAFPAAEIATAQWHRKQIGKVVDATTPAVLFHGHYHVRYRGDRGATAVIGLADDSSPLTENIVLLDLAEGDWSGTAF
ncbi:metallophosphoesterase [Mycolicibacterium sp.]|uniref:metallophosphoesterase family protein n=1 Tax=Mycolicibacterium sp. TaxID=2320850 RepID=UPI00355F58E4